MSNPQVEVYHSQGDDVASPCFGSIMDSAVSVVEEENMRVTIAQMHKQEIQNLKQNIQVHRKTLLESNPIVYVADVSNTNKASIVENQKQFKYKLSMVDR